MQTVQKWEIVAKVDYANSKTTGPVIGDTASSQVLADEIGSEDPTDAEIEESNKAPQNPGDTDNPMDLTVCPLCGSTELYTGRNVNGIVMDEDKVIGCHHCDWEYEVPNGCGRRSTAQKKHNAKAVGLDAAGGQSHTSNGLCF